MSTATVEPPAQKTLADPIEGGEQKGSPADLAAKFGLSAAFKPSARDPLHKQTVVTPEKAVESTDTETGSEIQESTETGQGSPTITKKPNFVKNQIQLKKEAEAKALELEQKLTKYEKEELPRLNQRVQELEQQIHGSDSKKETERLQKELESVNQVIQEKDQRLTEAEKRLKFLDLPNDPDFKRVFEAPMNAAYSRAATVIGNDAGKLAELQKAFSCISAAYKTTDPSEQQRQNNLAIEIVNGLHEQLTPIQQAQFQQGFWDLVAKAGDYVGALKNNEQTTLQIQENRQRFEQEERVKTTQRWSSAFKENADKVAAVVKYDDEMARIIVNKKIDDNTSVDEAIAKATIDDGGTQYPPEDIARILVQGANFKRLQAQVAAKDFIIAELNETIGKLRGGQTAGTTPSQGGNGTTAGAEKPAEKTPESFRAHFVQKFGLRV